MPPIKQLMCSVGLSTLLLTAAACSGDDAAGADGSPPSTRATDEVRVLAAERGSADEPAPLDPGRYTIPFLGADDGAPWAEVEVPTGWGQDRLLLATGPDLDPHLRRLELLAVDRVAPDPCNGTMVPVEGTVRDVVAALTAQSTVRPTRSRPVSIDGKSGQVVRFVVPQRLDVADCWDGQSLRPLGLGRGWTSVFPGWTYRVWVLDVDDDPLVILAAHGPETTLTELDELTAMVEGLTFVEPR